MQIFMQMKIHVKFLDFFSTGLFIINLSSLKQSPL